MEEVWRDIGLTSLNDDPAATLISATTNPSFQDFLATPKAHPRRGNDSVAEEITFFGSLASTPGTLLSLNPGSDFQYIETSTCDPLRPSSAVNGRVNLRNTPSFCSSHNSAFHVFGSAAVFPSFCQKRGQENTENSDDRRHKRMMKNRESAARSRARKQAYTNELELEVAHLQEENAKLKMQHEKLLASVPTQLPKKNSLTRTLTAPF